MELWLFIQDKLTEARTVYLMCVIHHRGSSPGRQGFKMAVADDASMLGSIGGGVMEFNLVEHCKGLLKTATPPAFAKHQIHKGTITNGSGMICSGEQTVVFYPLTQHDLPSVQMIVSSLQHGIAGQLEIRPDQFSFDKHPAKAKKYHYTFASDNQWEYHEVLNNRTTVYIIGGGHVGLATSKLLASLGFYIVLFDNREHLNTFEANHYAHEKHLVDYRKIGDHLTNQHAIIAIMTNKYTDDKLVLSQCIRIPHQFLGVLGSAAKLDVMFDVLGKEGFSSNELAKIHAPIGLPIRSQTPDEIAISIAAQLISLRRLIEKNT